MYEIIIVDDEPFAINELRQLSIWNDYDFKITKTFFCAEDAVSYIEENPTDVIFTDIKMTGINGVELAKKCFYEYPEIKVVIFSAYEDFQYAKTAIQYNVFSYLTKPVSYSELAECLEKLKATLDKQKSVKSFLSAETKLKRWNYFYTYLHGLKNENEITDKLTQDLKIPVKAFENPCAIIRICIDNLSHYLLTSWKYGKEHLYNAIDNLLIDNEDFCFISIKHSDNNIDVLIMSKKNDRNFSYKINSNISALKENLYNILKLDTEISISEHAGRLSFLPKYTYSDELKQKQIRDIISLIIENKYEEAIKIVNSFFILFQNNKEILVGFYCDIAKNLTEVFGTSHILPEIEEYDYNSLLENLIFLIISHADKPNKQNQIIEKALEYINLNYFNDLSLDDVANYVCLNKIYFSYYFKKHTNESFVSYITKIRINKAKEKLIKNPETKIIDICESVGYKSMPYFYKIFKFYTGTTPSKYRKSIENK